VWHPCPVSSTSCLGSLQQTQGSLVRLIYLHLGHLLWPNSEKRCCYVRFLIRFPRLRFVISSRCHSGWLGMYTTDMSNVTQGQSLTRCWSKIDPQLSSVTHTMLNVSWELVHLGGHLAITPTGVRMYLLIRSDISSSPVWSHDNAINEDDGNYTGDDSYYLKYEHRLAGFTKSSQLPLKGHH